jgi:hypothetical protein
MSSVIDPIMGQTLASMPTSRATYDQDGYCLWEFRNQTWMLKKDCCQAGYVPSQPPVESGRFQGQIRALAAVAAGNAQVTGAVEPMKA